MSHWGPAVASSRSRAHVSRQAERQLTGLWLRGSWRPARAKNKQELDGAIDRQPTTFLWHVTQYTSTSRRREGRKTLRSKAAYPLRKKQKKKSTMALRPGKAPASGVAPSLARPHSYGMRATQLTAPLQMSWKRSYVSRLTKTPAFPGSPLSHFSFYFSLFPWRADVPALLHALTHTPPLYCLSPSGCLAAFRWSSISDGCRTLNSPRPTSSSPGFITLLLRVKSLSCFFRREPCLYLK